jgi:protein O-GlcNAc transferase
VLSGLLRSAFRQAVLRLRPRRGADATLSELVAQAYAQAKAGWHGAAALTLERALLLAPHAAPLWNKLGFARLEIGLVDEAIPALRKALEYAPADLYARRNLLFALVLRSESPEELFAEHRACGELMEQGLPTAPPFSRNAKNERLRVGYVSGDFVRHAVSHFVEPILERHDRAQFEITCYHNRAKGDAVTERLRAYPGRWRNVAALDDAALAAQIREDGIHVLVDLSGHTAGNRLGAFARRCAPVQVTYHGYPTTTGLSGLDYRLTDALADPPGETDSHYVEKLVRLPGCLWCYRPALPSVAGRWRAQPAITFGSLNNGRKLSPHIVRLWAQVLLATPASRMVIASVSEGPLRKRILGELSAAGVAPQRVECVPWANAEDFAALHTRIDIALDAFPFGGGTTSIEALWHGVPVVTLAGAAFPSRGGRTILGNAGLAELVAHSEGEFVETATRLAADPGRVAQLHAELPARMRASPIMDEAGFVRRLEHAYLAMWSSERASPSC